MKACYTFDDLSDRSILDDGALLPARLAVLGYPARHSKSPQMQQAALDARGEKMRYIRLEVTPEQFEPAIHRLRELDFVGCNVTVPHKQAACRIADKKDELSEATGAVNTLQFAEGKIYGFNTDGPGFVAAIRDAFSLDVRDLRIVLLGAAGGAGTAIAHACARNGCECLVLANRTLEKAEMLKKKLAPLFIDENRLSGATDRLYALPLSENSQLAAAVREADLIVNATSLGLDPFDPSPVPASWIQPSHLIFDTLTHDTRLQADGIERGARVSNGFPMLIQQGALSFSRWFGGAADLNAMRRALNL